MAAQIPQYLTSAGLTTVFHPLGYAKVLIQVRISHHFIVLMDPTVISTTRNRNHKRNSTDFDTARDSRASDSVINFNFRFELVDYLHNHCQTFGLLYTHQIIVQLESNILSADIDVSTGTGVGNFINISSRSQVPVDRTPIWYPMSWYRPPIYFRYHMGVLSVVTVCVFVLSILFWFSQRTHYFWRVFRFLFMEHKQDYSVTSVKDVKVCF
jgi:hypothetical protein